MQELREQAEWHDTFFVFALLFFFKDILLYQLSLVAFNEHIIYTLVYMYKIKYTCSFYRQTVARKIVEL